MDKDKYFRTLQDLIKGIDKSDKAPDSLYEERLSKCLECERLTDGMCNACGCFVELRAAFKKNKCPYKQW